MAEKDADVQQIRELIKIMKENDLVKIDIKHGDDRICLRRAEPPKATSFAGPFVAPMPGVVTPAGVLEGHSGAPASSGTAKIDDDLLDIKSPIVGTFYEGPSPDSDPYVDLGSHVNSQTVVCIVEAMKVMNEIKAEVSGLVVEKRVSNGQAVEYGQVLFRVKPE
jgi:acetyl-CoA carboxylase biotin carboxyl carrier protein